MSTTNTRNGDRFILGMLSIGHLTNDWVAGTLWLLAPAIAASLGLGPTEVGLILAINGLGAGLMYIPAGILADRLGRPGLLMLISFWWVAIGYFTATVASGFWGITLLLAVGVMGDAFWHPVATGVLMKRFPERRAQVLGIHAMGGSIGADVLGPLSSGFLLGLFSWQTTLQWLTIPAIIMGIIFIFYSKRLDQFAIRRKTSFTLSALTRQWNTREGLRLVFLMIFYNMALYAMLSMTPLKLQNDYGVSPFVSGVIFACILLGGTVFQPITGKISDRIGRRLVILNLLIGATIFAFIAAFSSDFVYFVISLTIAIAMLTAVRPAILATAVEHTGGAESTTLGIVFTILDGVGALGAFLAGIAGETTLSYSFLMGAVLALIATILVSTLPSTNTI